MRLAFEVRATFAFTEAFKAVDAAVAVAAGRVSDWAGADGAAREHGWRVASFRQAVAMRRRLALVPGVTATARET